MGSSCPFLPAIHNDMVLHNQNEVKLSKEVMLPFECKCYCNNQTSRTLGLHCVVAKDVNVRDIARSTRFPETIVKIIAAFSVGSSITVGGHLGTDLGRNVL